jgi:hypothetical protein
MRFAILLALAATLYGQPRRHVLRPHPAATDPTQLTAAEGDTVANEVPQ